VVDHQNIEHAGDDRVNPAQVRGLVAIDEEFVDGPLFVDAALPRLLLVVLQERVRFLPVGWASVVLPECRPGRRADPYLPGEVPALIEDISDRIQTALAVF